MLLSNTNNLCICKHHRKIISYNCEFPKVINASFNKTGTKSLTDALRILGHNVQDCQESVYRHYPEWERLWNCQEPASAVYKDIFGPGNKWNYTACSDTPGNVLWESLLENFPDAKG